MSEKDLFVPSTGGESLSLSSSQFAIVDRYIWAFDGGILLIGSAYGIYYCLLLLIG